MECVPGYTSKIAVLKVCKTSLIVHPVLIAIKIQDILFVVWCVHDLMLFLLYSRVDHLFVLTTLHWL